MRTTKRVLIFLKILKSTSALDTFKLNITLSGPWCKINQFSSNIAEPKISWPISLLKGNPNPNPTKGVNGPRLKEISKSLGLVCDLKPERELRYKALNSQWRY